MWVSCSGERMNIDWWVFHIQFRIYRPLCWLKLCLSQPTTGWRVVWKFIGKRFLATSAYIGRRVACRPSLVRRHYFRPCTDRRPIEAVLLVPATRWAPRRSEPAIFRIHSVGEKWWQVSLKVSDRRVGISAHKPFWSRRSTGLDCRTPCIREWRHRPSWPLSDHSTARLERSVALSIKWIISCTMEAPNLRVAVWCCH